MLSSALCGHYRRLNHHKHQKSTSNHHIERFYCNQKRYKMEQAISETSPIVITGATGNIGREVVSLLRKAKLPIRIASTNPEKALQSFGEISADESVTATRFDFYDTTTFGSTFAGAKRVFLVRPPEISDTKKGMNPSIDAMLKNGVEQVVFLSLLGAEKNTIVPHRAVEDYLREICSQTSGTSMSWTFLRPSFFMQNLENAHREEIKTMNQIIVPAGNGATSFIDGRDIAAVAAKVLSEDISIHDKKAYDLTGSEALTYYDVANLMTAALGRPIKYHAPGIFHFLWRRIYQLGDPVAFAFVMVAIYTTARLGYAGFVSNELENLLGRKPITMKQYIEDKKTVWM